MHHRNTVASLLTITVIAILLATVVTRSAQQHRLGLVQSSPTVVGLHLGTRTKTSGCSVQGAFPDSACTPGAVFSSVTVQQICTSGYAASVRDVPESEKKAVYAEYGIQSHTKEEYEVDHLISLELGGSNDIANLWPEAANPTPGFHEKDKVENYLHAQVCSGKLSLPEAQEKIVSDWLGIWQTLANK